MADEPTMKWYGTGEVAKMFSVTTDTVTKWIKSDLLPATKINKHWRIAHDDLMAFGRAKYHQD